MAIRDHLVLFLNGNRHEVYGSDCFLSLSDFLRYRRGLTGTKIVCSEGDCGSCTVLVGQPEGEALRYRPIDSCIRQMFQLDGVHVVTVEGIGGLSARLGNPPASHSHEPRLTSVQQAMVECHGSQCGFCTPGFVMAMHGVCETCNGHAASEEQWRHELTGNLCRCTGYTTILKAGLQAVAAGTSTLNDLYPPAAMLEQLSALRNDVLDLQFADGGMQRRAYGPTTIDQAVAFRRENPQAKIIAGATDVGVQLNKRVIAPATFLDLNRVVELEELAVESIAGTRQIVAGARATWTQLLELCRSEVPEFAEIVSVFGSPQIRHVGTIGGNIINASPIADSLPFLFVMEAELELAGPTGRRTVNINQFYHSYKKFDLRPDELLVSIRIPLPCPGELLRLYKVSRRRDLDISTFTAALRLELASETISHAALAYGAVGPTVLRLRKTEQFLEGRAITAETMAEAGDVAVAEITPISDVRGSQDYRFQLARNVLLKFYHEHEMASV
ncbi:MAG TPA: FAD binding domain-containing protein [Pirellulales bacterium]|jgi:xanthine dehydrogenase small subunit|nr:FAD binding domain-containing protein [Pirellulales bacterium]